MHFQEIPFKFEIPFEVFHKAGESGKERRIGGMVSTERKDRQGETILQRGLDFSEFISNGWFNDNNSKETAGIVGYPIKVEKRNYKGTPGHYVEGYLLDNYEPADKIWNLANALQKTGRRLGFSVEGAIGQREYDGRVIAKAKVRNVAITNCPVNTDTGLEILTKSIQAIEQKFNQDEWLNRALMAGQAISNPGTSPGQGFPLRVESMERKIKRKRKLSRDEAEAYLQSRYHGLTKAEVKRILDFVNTRHTATS